MGLDGVELVMAVEESFKIAIDDSEASAARTAGQLMDLVMAKLQPGASKGCITSHAFYRLRASVARLTGLPRRALAPTTCTETLWSPRQRRQAWSALAAETGLELPALSRPPAVTGIAAVTVVVGAALVGFGLTPQLAGAHPGWLAIIALASAAGLTGLAAPVTRLAARRLPPGCDTLGGLARELVTLNFATLAAAQQQWGESEVWEALRNLIARHLAVAKDDVTRDANFVEDLGLS